MQKVVTHNSGFHADDVFAVATLQLYLGLGNIKIIRTRNQSIIDDGDWVLDVGGVYDPSKQRFDHHQTGAPERNKGIPYAAFGLIWKHVGERVAGSKRVADMVEQKLVMPIDAPDNGVSLYSPIREDVLPITISDMVALLCPVRGSDEDLDKSFEHAVEIARHIIERAVKHAQSRVTMMDLAVKVYNETEDKRVLVFDTPMSRNLMIEYPEVLFMICPDDPATNDNWQAVAVAKEKGTFETRSSFPSEWGGLRDQELAEVSGVNDAVFCHRNNFLFIAGSKEGALSAVEKALY